jgi:hypothetical protein
MDSLHEDIWVLAKPLRESTWLHVRSDMERWCQHCDTFTVGRDPQTWSQGLMHHYDIGASFKRIAIIIAGPLLESRSGNPYFMIAMDSFTKLLEVYTIPKQEAPLVADILVISFCCFGVPEELYSDQCQNL